jgi:hypothetical protein
MLARYYHKIEPLYTILAGSRHSWNTAASVTGKRWRLAAPSVLDQGLGPGSTCNGGSLQPLIRPLILPVSNVPVSESPAVLNPRELKHDLTDFRFIHDVLTARTLKRHLLELCQASRHSALIGSLRL